MQSLDFNFNDVTVKDDDAVDVDYYKFFETYKQLLKCRTKDVVSYKQTPTSRAVLKLRSEIKKYMNNCNIFKEIHKECNRSGAGRYCVDPFEFMHYTEL